MLQDKWLSFHIDGEIMGGMPVPVLPGANEQICLGTDGSCCAFWGGVELLHTPLGDKRWESGVQAVHPDRPFTWRPWRVRDREEGEWALNDAGVISSIPEAAPVASHSAPEEKATVKDEEPPAPVAPAVEASIAPATIVADAKAAIAAAAGAAATASSGKEKRSSRKDAQTTEAQPGPAALQTRADRRDGHRSSDAQPKRGARTSDARNSTRTSSWRPTL